VGPRNGVPGKHQNRTEREEEKTAQKETTTLLAKRKEENERKKKHTLGTRDRGDGKRAKATKTAQGDHPKTKE